MTTAAKGEMGQEDGFKKPWKRPSGAQRRKMTRMGKEVNVEAKGAEGREDGTIKRGRESVTSSEA
ncbi:unnamed protein product, partial [Allacma fusca]